MRRYWPGRFRSFPWRWLWPVLEQGRRQRVPTSPAEATTTSAAAAPNPLAEKAATEYKAYAVGQIDELVRVVKVFTDAVRANNLQAAQDAYAPSRMPWERIEPLAGPGRGDRRQGRRTRRRLRGRRRSGIHRLAPPRVPAVREEHHRGRRPVRRPARQGHRHAEGAVRDGRGRRRSTSPTARPNSSKRSRRARSPARRIATPRPTSGTSTQTCRARRPRSTS